MTDASLGYATPHEEMWEKNSATAASGLYVEHIRLPSDTQTSFTEAVQTRVHHINIIRSKYQ